MVSVLGNTDEVLGMFSTECGRSPGTPWQSSVCGDAWLGFGDSIIKKKVGVPMSEEGVVV